MCFRESRTPAQDRYRQSPKGQRTIRNRWYQQKYNISLEQFEEMERRQRGRCAICGSLPNHRALHVDHAHNTGKVRGLLCSNCNRGIGHLGESPKRLMDAIRYLKEGGSHF